jgi:ketosteroid isomerase-like protein
MAGTHTDREQIQELLHHYCDAVLRQDADAWADTWADDCWWNLGKGRLVHGKQAIVELWTGSIGKNAVVVQVTHNGAVTIDGDTASGRWYISENMERINGDKAIMLAYYDDTYARINNRWLFTSRAITAIYHGPPDLSGPFVRPL